MRGGIACHLLLECRARRRNRGPPISWHDAGIANFFACLAGGRRSHHAAGGDVLALTRAVRPRLELAPALGSSRHGPAARKRVVIVGDTPVHAGNPIDEDSDATHAASFFACTPRWSRCTAPRSRTRRSAASYAAWSMTAPGRVRSLAETVIRLQRCDNASTARRAGLRRTTSSPAAQRYSSRARALQQRRGGARPSVCSCAARSAIEARASSNASPTCTGRAMRYGPRLNSSHLRRRRTARRRPQVVRHRTSQSPYRRRPSTTPCSMAASSARRI